MIVLIRQNVRDLCMSVSLLLLGGRAGSTKVDDTRHVTLNFVETMSHVVNEQVEEEGCEDGQLNTSDRVSHPSQKVVRSLNVVFAEGITKDIDSTHGMYVEHVDDGNRNDTADKGDDAAELCS